MKQLQTDWRSTLQTIPRPVSARPADDFWRDFRARCALHPQHSVAAREQRQWPFLLPALAAAGIAVLLAGGLCLARGWGRQGPSTVQSYSIEGRYTSVMLLTDESAQATILWVSGMETDDDDDWEDS